jgi:hypothetical protein
MEVVNITNVVVAREINLFLIVAVALAILLHDWYSKPKLSSK